MHIILNDSPHEIESTLTVEALLSTLHALKPGMAIAVNQQIIPQDQWSLMALHEGDNVLLFQAIAGG